MQRAMSNAMSPVMFKVKKQKANIKKVNLIIY